MSASATKLQNLRVKAAALQERGRSQAQRIQALEVELGNNPAISQNLTVTEIQAQITEMERQDQELSQRAKELTDAAEQLLV